MRTQRTLSQEIPLKEQQHIDDEASLGTTGYKLISSRLLSSDGHFKRALLVAKLPLAAHQTAGELCSEPTSWFVVLHPLLQWRPGQTHQAAPGGAAIVAFHVLATVKSLHRAQSSNGGTPSTSPRWETVVLLFAEADTLPFERCRGIHRCR